jgi:hypothetical protein
LPRICARGRDRPLRVKDRRSRRIVKPLGSHHRIKMTVFLPGYYAIVFLPGCYAAARHERRGLCRRHCDGIGVVIPEAVIRVGRAPPVAVIGGTMPSIAPVGAVPTVPPMCAVPAVVVRSSGLARCYQRRAEHGRSQ